MNLNYLLEMIDYLIEFYGLMGLCLTNWDANRVLSELIHFRKRGQLSGEYLSTEGRPVFNLLLHELKAQIQEADPEWFEACAAKQEDRQREARIVDAFLEEQASIEAEAGREADFLDVPGSDA